ncbi:MAG: hypothetical protein V2B20_07315 [Pseudomonadota bacterium]
MKCCRKSLRLFPGLLCGSMLLFGVHTSWAEESGSTMNHEKTLFEYLQGEPTDDQLLLGMVTLHFNSKSRRIRQWDNKLVGLQYKDFFVCTYENSFFNQTVAAGMARNFSTSELSNNWDMTFGYRLGVAYGYKDGEAPFSSASPIIPVVEIYNQYFFKKHYGVELMLTTSISASLFYQF